MAGDFSGVMTMARFHRKDFSMKATLQIDLKAPTPSEAQRFLLDACEKMKLEGLIKEYHFEIDTPEGLVTEKCILAGEKVIA